MAPKKIPVTAWKKGDPSPNPKGRPPEHPELRAAIQKWGPDAVEFLRKAFQNTGAEMKDRIAAAKFLVEYSLPKLQSVELSAREGSAMARALLMLATKGAGDKPDDE